MQLLNFFFNGYDAVDLFESSCHFDKLLSLTKRRKCMFVHCFPITCGLPTELKSVLTLNFETINNWEDEKKLFQNLKTTK